MSKRNNSYTEIPTKRKFTEADSSINLKSSEKKLIESAILFGFDQAKIVDIKKTKNQNIELLNFLEKNYHGEMSWMADRTEIRSDPKNIWNEAKSILVFF